MNDNKPGIGKKGGARRVAEEFAKLRKAPLPKEAFRILDRYNQTNAKNINKSNI